jgi:tetratricopeptide (TPR) repeat protein
MKNVAAKNTLSMQKIASLVAQGQLSGAREALNKIVKKNPREYDALLGLSHISDLMGDTQRAVEYANRATAVIPNRFEGYCQLGQLYKKRLEFDKAGSCFHKAVRLEPGSSQLWQSLGLVRMEDGRLAEAVECLKKAVSLDTRFAVGHYNLANALKKYGRSSESIAHYEKALALKPDLIEARNNLGNAYIGSGDLDAAERCFKEVLKQSPGFLNAVSGLARICDYRREFDSAHSLLEPYAKRKVAHVGLAATYADIAPSIGKTEEAILWLERIVASAEVPEADKARAYFVLAKLLDGAGDYAAAFTHYERANRIRHADYDIDIARQFFAHIRQSFSREKIAAWGVATNRDPRPVFIVGMPRSGTSLVEQILAGSPDVYAAGETEDIDLLVSEAAAHTSNGEKSAYKGANIGAKEIEALSSRYSRILDERCGHARRHVDKMPHNFIHLGLISLVAPGARIIHCVRDPLDTCLSCYFQDFSGFHPYSNSLSDLAQYYCLYADLMTHWVGALKLPIKHVCYEQLIANPEGIAKDIFSFCDIEWRSEYLKIQETGRVVTTLSYDQVRRPIYSTSVKRWRNYASHLEPLRREFSRLGREEFSWEAWCAGSASS